MKRKVSKKTSTSDRRNQDRDLRKGLYVQLSHLDPEFDPDLETRQETTNHSLEQRVNKLKKGYPFPIPSPRAEYEMLNKVGWDRETLEALDLKPGDKRDVQHYYASLQRDVLGLGPGAFAALGAAARNWAEEGRVKFPLPQKGSRPKKTTANRAAEAEEAGNEAEDDELLMIKVPDSVITLNLTPEQAVRLSQNIVTALQERVEARKG